MSLLKEIIMKKMLTQTLIVTIMTSALFLNIALANTTDQINQFQKNTPTVENNVETLDPATSMETEIAALRAEFVKVSNDVSKNARQVQYLGANWSASHTESERLKFLQQQAQTKTKGFEEDIQAIIGEQNQLTQRSIILVQQLSSSMSPQDFELLRREVIIPKAMELETMKQSSINFIRQMESGHKQVMSNTEQLTVENHIALTAYDQKQVKKFLLLNGGN